MNILHISDFHYDGDNRICKRVLPAIVDAIKSSNINIDFILFTGDLVFSGNSKKKFEDAQKILYDYFCDEINVPRSNVIFCPGNHDIDIESIHDGVCSYVKNNIVSNIELNVFYSKPPKYLLSDSLRPLSNYVDFAKKFHPNNEDNIYKDLYSIHFRKNNSHTYAFVCIYTPWLSSLELKKNIKDYGNLFYPEPAFKDITRDIANKADKAVLLMHHPLSFFKEFNSYEIENHIYNDFQMCFVGHVHKMQTLVIHNGLNGIFEHVANSSLSDKENLGCSLISIDDAEDNIFNVQELSYVPESNSCFVGEPISIAVPIGKDKEEKNKLRRKLYDKIAIEINNANNLLLMKVEEGGKDFLATYTNPRIKSSKEDAINATVAPVVPINSLFNSIASYFILGKDKCGKTSLLRRIQLEYLINYSSYGLIPLFIDAIEDEHNIDDNYNFEDKLREYLNLNKKCATEIINSEQFVLLIDNLNLGRGFSNYFQSFIQSHQNCKFFATMDDNLSNSIGLEKLKFGKDYLYDTAYFHDLRKQEIIKYTESQLIGYNDANHIQEKIIKLCKQMALPCNYWTVSLLLLIHQKSSDTYSKNLYSILDVCVDEIFGKKKLLIQPVKITFEQLKCVCASLAAYLFENHEDTIYSATKDEIISFIQSECNKNVRITADAISIFDFFEACGILKMKYGGRYVFRLNGFFEYFLAFYMTKDVAFKNRILEDDVKYLGFKNQLEIYSGLKHDDYKFLQLVLEKTKTKCVPLFKNYSDDKDAQLLSMIELPSIIENQCREISIKESLPSIRRAEIEDLADCPVSLNSEVHLIQNFDPNSVNSEIIGRHLSILARILKNIDECQDSDIDIASIFRLIVDYYCDYSFYLVNELSKSTSDEMHNAPFSDVIDSDELKLLKLISNFSPLMAEVELFDGLGHYSLVRLIIAEINRLRENVEKNQYKLFILYFLLLDIDIEEYYKEYVDMAIDDITKIPLLRYMLLLKLNYYIGFKSNGNKALEQFLSNKVQKVKLLLDNKTDIGSIQKSLAYTRKNAMINKKAKI